MSYLSDFFFRRSDDEQKLILGAASLVVVAGLWAGGSLYRADIRDHSVIGEPLYGRSLAQFIETLDQKPDGRTDTLRLNKAFDRFMADVVSASMKTLDLKDGKVFVPTGQQLSERHLDEGRYQSVKDMELTIRTGWKRHRGVRDFGPQAEEKLVSVKEVISHFERLVSAVETQDVSQAKAELQQVQEGLENYLNKYHAREHDLDRASADLRRLDRQLDVMNNRVASASPTPQKLGF